MQTAILIATTVTGVPASPVAASMNATVGYRMVFEAVPPASPWSGYAWFVALCGLTLGLYLWQRRTGRPMQRAWMVVAFLVVSGVVIGVGFAIGTWEDRLCRQALAGQVGETVEGTVTDFEAMPVSGHRAERFRVGGREFEYSQFDTRPFFHHAAAFGGPLREGLRVRIRHVDGRIVRLETAE